MTLPNLSDLPQRGRGEKGRVGRSRHRLLQLLWQERSGPVWLSRLSPIVCLGRLPSVAAKTTCEKLDPTLALVGLRARCLVLLRPDKEVSQGLQPQGRCKCGCAV
jgi:hypothetical protein